MIKWLLIKSASHKFNFRSKGRYTTVSLPNGRCWSFTKQEIAELNTKNCIGFRRPSVNYPVQSLTRVKNFVRLCFAVMVRHLQLYGYAGKTYTEQSAIRALTKQGIDTTRFHLLLGLKRTASKKLTKTNLNRAKKEKAVLLYNKKHIAVMAGNYYDNFGKAAPVPKQQDKLPVLFGKEATAWYTMK